MLKKLFTSLFPKKSDEQLVQLILSEIEFIETNIEISRTYLNNPTKNGVHRNIATYNFQIIMGYKRVYELTNKLSKPDYIYKVFKIDYSKLSNSEPFRNSEKILPISKDTLNEISESIKNYKLFINSKLILFNSNQ
jgi:hypothetical protein